MDERVIKLATEEYFEEDFKFHIQAVVKNALILSDKLNADKEVVETAAYLHDIGRATKTGEGIQKENDHHIEGEKKTRKILTEFRYDKEFIDKVAHCVLTHRGRKGPEPETLEAQIIACADAMSHFDTFLELFQFFTTIHNTTQEAVEALKQKMQRDWEIKLSLPEAKEIVKPKYEAIMLLLNSMEEYF